MTGTLIENGIADSDLTSAIFGHRHGSMTKDRTLTRKDVVAFTGVPNDVLTFWLRSDLIRPSQGQERAKMRLRFCHADIRIAAVLNHARSIGLNVDALRAIADALYDSENTIAQFGLTAEDGPLIWDERNRRAWTPEDRDQILEDYRRSANFERLAYWKKKFAEEDATPLSDRATEIVDHLEAKGYHFTEITLGLLANEGMMALFRGQDGSWRVEREPALENGLPAPFCVIFNLADVFERIDWNKS